MPKRNNSKTALIKKAPLFANCSRRELAAIASLADEIDLAEGKELTKQGASGREFFVLIEGTAEVLEGESRVNELGPGDFFGEVALVRDSPRTATVRATSPVRALVITAQNFKRLLERSPDIERKVLKALVERFPS